MAEASRHPVPVEDLHALADGQVSPRRRAALQALLADHPGDARLVNDVQCINRALRTLYGPLANEPVPPNLRPEAIRFRLGKQRRALWGRLAAALVLGIALGGGFGWWAHGVGGRADVFVSAGQRPLVERAVTAYAVYAPEVLHPVEVGSEQSDHLFKWLSKRLGGPVRAPALEEQGFRLIGGRLLPDDGGPAAQFMYESETGERLALYVRTGMTQDAGTAFRFLSAANGINAFYWVDGTFGYALVGTLARPRLEVVAHQAYIQISP